MCNENNFQTTAGFLPVKYQSPNLSQYQFLNAPAVQIAGAV
jgi:hypothetical protein